jgi:OmpA-OmpF porin, OOP family
MMKLTFFLLLFSPVLLFAQTSEKALSLYNDADVAFKERKFDKGIQLLKKAIEKEPDFVQAHFKLATIYFSVLIDRNKAIPYYQKTIALKPDEPAFAVAYENLGNYYLQLGKYEMAKQHLEKYLTFESKSNKEEARRRLANCNFALEAIKKPLNFQPRPLAQNINKFALQYFPVLTADQQTLIFTARQTYHTEGDENIYVSEKKNGNWQTPFPISDIINTDFNEGTCSISADGRTMVFVCCGGRQGYGNCDLYITYKIGNEWAQPENMGNLINQNSWDSQPSLSADGRRLFFASDRKGGKGKRDIWMSVLDEKNSWQKPTNLGEGINTAADEYSPFVHVNGSTLYFASRGLPGMGGSDLYFSEMLNGRFTAPQNVGYPVNDHLDQVALFITADGKKGYFTKHSQTKSDLYEFDVPEQMTVKYASNVLKGTVYDATTKEKLAANIELFDVRKDSLVTVMNSDKISGQYLTVLTEGSEYALFVNRTGYLFKSLNFNYAEKKDREPLVIDIYLQPITAGAKEVMNNIFFNTNAYQLNAKSETEIYKIARFLNEHPQLKLEISGHTDDVASEAYNQQLSEKRAKSVYDYLIQKKIDSVRLRYVGYGKKQPVVANDSEENRSRNRRIEFKILSQ